MPVRVGECSFIGVDVAMELFDVGSMMELEPGLCRRDSCFFKAASVTLPMSPPAFYQECLTTLQGAVQLSGETGKRAKVYEQQLLAQSGVSVALLRFMGQLCDRLRVAFVCVMQTPLGLRTVVYRRHRGEPGMAVRLLLWGSHAVALVRHDGDTSWSTAAAVLA